MVSGGTSSRMGGWDVEGAYFGRLEHPDRFGVNTQIGLREQGTRKLEMATGRVIPWLFHRQGKPIKSFRRPGSAPVKRPAFPGRIPHDFRRTAVRNLERAGVARSAAMKMVGHKTQAIYSRYAIADESMLQEGGVKLAALHAREAQAERVVIPMADVQAMGTGPTTTGKVGARSVHDSAGATTDPLHK